MPTLHKNTVQRCGNCGKSSGGYLTKGWSKNDESVFHAVGSDVSGGRVRWEVHVDAGAEIRI
jgi:hypothetical protein